MKFIPVSVTSRLAIAVLKVQKHSPSLLFVGGVTGTVATVVLASRATLKLPEILDNTNEYVEKINQRAGTRPDYTVEDGVKDKALLYFQTGTKITKLYLPALIVGSLSVAALTGSHNILNRRNAALTAAYAAVDQSFRQYRDRVIADLGEEKERKYRYGTETVETTVVDDEGKKVKKSVTYPTALSEYGRLFHEGNPNHQERAEYNFFFLRAIQNMANEKLQSQGYVLLNDVYKDLGFETTKAGMVVGWLKDGDGDGYVDFGLFDDKEALRIFDYVTGREGELYLNFNVDGNIFEKMR